MAEQALMGCCRTSSEMEYSRQDAQRNFSEYASTKAKYVTEHVKWRRCKDRQTHHCCLPPNTSTNSVILLARIGSAILENRQHSQGNQRNHTPGLNTAADNVRRISHRCFVDFRPPGPSRTSSHPQKRQHHRNLMLCCHGHLRMPRHLQLPLELPLRSVDQPPLDSQALFHQGQEVSRCLAPGNEMQDLSWTHRPPSRAAPRSHLLVSLPAVAPPSSGEINFTLPRVRGFTIQRARLFELGLRQGPSLSLRGEKHARNIRHRDSRVALQRH